GGGSPAGAGRPAVPGPSSSWRSTDSWISVMPASCQRRSWRGSGGASASRSARRVSRVSRSTGARAGAGARRLFDPRTIVYAVLKNGEGGAAGRGRRSRAGRIGEGLGHRGQVLAEPVVGLAHPGLHPRLEVAV